LTDLASADATETAALIQRGDITALEAVESAIARAELMQPQLNFMVTETFAGATRRARNRALRGPFAGVPYLVKDMYDVEGVPTRWGAGFGAFLPPATANSPQVDAVEDAGMVIIGKSALGEIGYLPTTEPLVSGPTLNPWDVAMSPGGSSGGAAAAVAAGVVPMADAADGGGSIRIPASACGLFGLKPTRDRLVGTQEPAAGYPVTVEHCVSRTVRDSAGLFAAMERTDPASQLPPVGAVVGPSERRLRIGLVMESLTGQLPAGGVAAAIEATASTLESLGHRVEPAKYSFDTANVMAHFAVLWASSALHVFELVENVTGSDPDETLLEPFTLAMAASAAALPDGTLPAAIAALEAVSPQYEATFSDYDVLLSPVTLTPTVPIGHIAGDVALDTLAERISAYADYTVLHNVAGAPAMSVPLSVDLDGLPVGSHFAAKVGDERTLFELAYELEAASPWVDRKPGVCCMPG
jgi:amidase